MLSRVAERLYWTARYLERVESTARLVHIYDQLLFDLPRSVNLSWYNLIIINSLETEFSERYSVRDERNVVKFLIGDESNPCSMLSSLTSIRENVRTTRDVIPEEAWELVNELSLYVKDNLQQGISRRNRHNFLQEVIQSCQQILGLFYGNMAHDEAWSFLRLGRNLERADMTTRILDAGVAAIIEMQDDDSAINSRQIVLGNVLRSLNGDQAYRRLERLAVNGPAVIDFLISNPYFPRAICHCCNSLIHASSQLPRSKTIVSALKTLQEKIYIDENDIKLDQSLREYINSLQIDLGNMHSLVAENWFPTLA